MAWIFLIKKVHVGANLYGVYNCYFFQKRINSYATYSNSQNHLKERAFDSQLAGLLSENQPYCK